MKTYELTYKNKKLTKGLTAGALALGALLPSIAISNEAGAAPTKSVEKPAATVYADKLGNKALNQAILNEELTISKDIAQRIPVEFKDTIAYVTSSPKGGFYIENPLTATVQVGKSHKKTQLIGYIEPKGSGAGPDVVLFEANPKTVKEMHDPADPKSMPAKNPVIFPSMNNAAYDISNPANPFNFQMYTDLAQNPSLVAYKYSAKK